MTGSDEARSFFAALAEERWEEAVGYLSKEFVESHRETIRFRLEGLRKRYVAESDLEIPDDDLALCALWLERSDYRVVAERELAQARFEEPDRDWRIVGGVPALNRHVVGEIAETDERAVVVYRVYGERGSPRVLELVRENGRWLVSSDQFSLEGNPGLTPLVESRGEP